MNGYKGNDQLLRQQSSTKAHEAQLLDARRQRKETDEQFQAMMNRIAFLAQEELRLDRDIEAARRRAAEALARQATRDQEIAATAKEVLAVMPAAAPPKLVRPHTGRSSLFASLSEGASTSTPASGAPSLRASATATSSQHSIRSLDSGPSASPTASIPAPGGLGPGPAGGAICGSGPGAGPGPGSGHPPRAPSASRSRPPVPAGRAADKAGKLPPVAPGSGIAMIRSPSPSGGARPSSASRPSTAASGGGGRSRASSTSPTSSSISGSASARRFSTDASAAAPPSASPTSPSPPPPPRSGRKAADDGGLTLHPSGLTHITGMHQLPGGPPPHGAADLFPGSELPPVLGAAGSGPLSARNTMTHVHGGELAAVDLPSGLGGGGGGAASGRNAMTVIHGGAAAAAVGELDGEVVEELTQGSRSAAAPALGGPSGLQEFATESGRRVVLVKASRKTEGTTVSAAGVGWGMGGRGAGGATSIAPKEARQLQAELAKKQQIWKVRKTFGLEPTPMSDRSAQVEEVGAGAWQ